MITETILALARQEAARVHEGYWDRDRWNWDPLPHPHKDFATCPFEPCRLVREARLIDGVALASGMRKVLPPDVLADLVERLDPLSPFVAFLRTYEVPK